jgi:hypothetical protein
MPMDNQIIHPDMLEKAIEFVMNFYHISRIDALMYYDDEIDAYLSLIKKGITE